MMNYMSYSIKKAGSIPEIEKTMEEPPTPISKPKSELQPEPEKNTPPASDSSKPVSKKVPPPIPPKPDHLKVSTNSSNTDDKQEPLGIPGPSGTSIESQSIETKTEVKSLEPKPEEEMPPTQPNPPIVQQSIKLKKKPDALIKLENKENRTKKEVKDYQTLYLDWITSGVDNLESSKPITKPPEPNVYMDDKIEALFQSAKNLCEEDGYDPEEFDGESLAIEIEDLSNHKVYDMKADPYHYSLNRLYNYIEIRVIEVLTICTLIHPMK